MVDEPNLGDSRLTGAPWAVIDTDKLTRYALDPTHERGGDKARVFASVLGFDLDNHDELIEQLRQGVSRCRALPGRADEFGARFVVDIPVVGPRGRATVRTAWIYDPGSPTPRLTTLYVR